MHVLCDVKVCDHISEIASPPGVGFEGDLCDCIDGGKDVTCLEYEVGKLFVLH